MDRVRRRKEKALQKALKVLDPDMIAAHHLRPEDEAIRNRDVPERLQLLGRLYENKPDYEACATWVHRHLFGDEVRTPLRFFNIDSP